MHDAHAFLQAIALVLGVAAVTTVLFQRLGQPVVLGYLLAGMIIGPHVPIPLVADPAIVTTLSELGVILLMFGLGLEFSLRKFIRVGPVASLTALVETSFMVWLGFVTGRAFGWSGLESAFLGALVAISSTTIIAKAFEAQGVKGRFKDLVVGVLVVEDLIAILLMALLTGVASGSGLSAGALAVTLGKLVAFLVGLVVAGLFVVPRVIRFVVKLERPETLLVASVGLCFSVALVAQAFGYSVALGAFLAGSLVAESGEEKKVEHLVTPVKDVFAAIFFVSVGMLIDPKVVAEHWGAVLVVTLVVIVGKVLGVTIGAFLTGMGTRTALQAGMSLAQIGEFSFIIASLGLSLHATGDYLYPVAVSVSAITTLTTPTLIRLADPVSRWVDRKLPKRLQTFATLYASWVEELGKAGPVTVGTTLRRTVLLLALDAASIGAIVVGGSVYFDESTTLLRTTLGVNETIAGWTVVVLAATACGPFAVGVIRLSRRLGTTLAGLALPHREDGKLDLAAAPRKVLLVTLQLTSILLVGVPLVALTQPFLPGFQGALVLGAAIAIAGVTFWRNVTNLQGHVVAGVEVIVEALAAQSHEAADEAEKTRDVSLERVRSLLPGLGAPVALRLEAGSPAVGRTLAQLGLRARTGASVLALQRGDGDAFVPTAQETLQAGDLLAVAGSQAALEAARELLGAAPASA